MGYLIDIAVLDSYQDELFMYCVDSDWNTEKIEDFLFVEIPEHLDYPRHKEQSCNWATFKSINDERTVKNITDVF